MDSLKDAIVQGMAAGALTTLVCTSKFGEAGRNWLLGLLNRHKAPRLLREKLDQLLCCTFCTSWWISIAMLDRFSVTQWAATVTVANISILLIHWGLSTIEVDDEVV